MKTRFFTTLFFYVFLSCNLNNKSQYLAKSSGTLSVSVTVVSHINAEWFNCERGYYGFERRDYKGNLFPIEISIKNNSDSALRFWEMTCSWQSNWILSDTTIGLFWPNCDGNFPTIRTIEPGKAYSHKCFIYSEHPINEIINREMNIGFILIKEQDYHVFPYTNYFELVKNKRDSKQNLIWSNSFKLI